METSPNQDHPAAADAGTPLIVVDTLPPEYPLLPTEGAVAIDEAVACGEGVVWIRGPVGWGRTTATRERLERLTSELGLLGILRIECWPGLPFEESLFLVGDFLSQLGLREFGEVLSQRTPAAGKLRILCEILREVPVCLWFDDWEELLVTTLHDGRSLLRTFVDSWSLLEGGRGRLLVVSERSGPDGLIAEETAARAVELDGARLVDPAEVWARWRGTTPEGDPSGAAAPDFEQLPSGLRSPLAQGILLSSLRHSSTRDDGAAVIADLLDMRTFSGLVSTLRDHLSEEARRALDFLALYRRPMSRGALRSLAERWGLPELESKGLDELRGWGLLSGPREDGERLRLHPQVRGVAERRARAEDPEHWRRMHTAMADLQLKAASRSRSLWSYFRAYRHLMDGGAHREAYETHKMFVEEFLAIGFLGLARSVFEECAERLESPYREIVTGNLAIIYKGEGNHDEAIRLYEQSLERFTESGDLANAARVHHQIGNTYYLKGDSFRALENYRLCMEIAEKINDASVLLLVKVQIANVQFSSGDMNSAIDAYREAVAIASDTGNATMVTALHLQIAQVHVARKQYAEARERLKSAEETAIDKDDYRSLLKVHQLRGIMLKAELQLESAVTSFECAAEFARLLGDLVEQANCRIHAGKALEEDIRLPEAARSFVEARRLLESLAASPLDDKDREAMTRNLETVAKAIDGVRAKLGDEDFRRAVEG